MERGRAAPIRQPLQSLRALRAQGRARRGGPGGHVVDVLVRRGVHVPRRAPRGGLLRARRLEAEWLDHLAADDPRARRSRADLRRLHALMGNTRVVVSALRSVAADAPRSWVELGAGDGAFSLK